MTKSHETQGAAREWVREKLTQIEEGLTVTGAREREATGWGNHSGSGNFPDPNKGCALDKAAARERQEAQDYGRAVTSEKFSEVTGPKPYMGRGKL